MLRSQVQVKLSGAVQAEISLASLNIKVCIWARAAPCLPKGKSREGKGAGRVTKFCSAWGLRGFRRNCPNSCVSPSSLCPLRRAAASLALQGCGTGIREGNGHPSIAILCPTQLLSHQEITVINTSSRYCSGWTNIQKGYKKVWIIFSTFHLNNEGNVFQIFLDIFSQN